MAAWYYTLGAPKMKAGRRAYNERRSELARQCREKLASQLRDRLGLIIEPSQVRLKTESTDDAYVWERTEDMEPIFRQNFSDLSSGSLMRLYEALNEDEGKLKVNALSKHVPKNAPVNLSFKEKISIQQQEMDRLSSELLEWKNIAESESQKRHELQHEANRLRSRVKQLEEERQRMQREIDQWKRVSGQLHDGVNQCHQGSNAMMKILDSMNMGINDRGENSF